MTPAREEIAVRCIPESARICERPENLKELLNDFSRYSLEPVSNAKSRLPALPQHDMSLLN